MMGGLNMYYLQPKKKLLEMDSFFITTTTTSQLDKETCTNPKHSKYGNKALTKSGMAYRSQLVLYYFNHYFLLLDFSIYLITIYHNFLTAGPVQLLLASLVEFLRVTARLLFSTTRFRNPSSFILGSFCQAFCKHFPFFSTCKTTTSNTVLVAFERYSIYCVDSILSLLYPNRQQQLCTYITSPTQLHVRYPVGTQKVL